MAKVSDTDTAEETMESLDDPDRADEDGAPEAKDQRPDTDLLTCSRFYGKIIFAITTLKYMKWKSSFKITLKST